MERLTNKLTTLSSLTPEHRPSPQLPVVPEADLEFGSGFIRLVRVEPGAEFQLRVLVVAALSS